MNIEGTPPFGIPWGLPSRAFCLKPIAYISRARLKRHAV